MKKLKLEELGRVDVPTFKAQEKAPIVLVADNIRSGLNVGSLFRSADAFNIQKIILCGVSPKPPHKEINKSAIGATFSVDWEYETSIEDCIRKLRSNGYQIIGVEQTNQSIPLADITPNFPIAIVMGNEVDGISESILGLLDIASEIPQYGTKHSLNVSVCAGIYLYQLSEVAKQL